MIIKMFLFAYFALVERGIPTHMQRHLLFSINFVYFDLWLSLIADFIWVRVCFSGTVFSYRFYVDKK